MQKQLSLFEYAGLDEDGLRPRITDFEQILDLYSTYIKTGKKETKDLDGFMVEVEKLNEKLRGY